MAPGGFAGGLPLAVSLAGRWRDAGLPLAVTLAVTLAAYPLFGPTTGVGNVTPIQLWVTQNGPSEGLVAMSDPTSYFIGRSMVETTPPQYFLVLKEFATGVLGAGLAYTDPTGRAAAEARFTELARQALQRPDCDWTPRFLRVAVATETEFRLLAELCPAPQPSAVGV